MIGRQLAGNRPANFFRERLNRSLAPGPSIVIYRGECQAATNFLEGELLDWNSFRVARLI